MVTFDELRVCKSCGNVFSKKTGVTIIAECPQCKGISFDRITTESVLDEEKMYLDELD
ncbi:MAG: hypothetical protein K5785_04535 [Nitrosarchaeum sp.]|nr:hypothetical protein [Nitrosarchaeum sp.]